MDILIPEEKVGDFFFLDDAEEKKQYGASADYKQAAALTQQLVQGSAKAKKTAKTDKYKQMVDFKARALDFLSIFIKQRAYQRDPQI